MILNADATTIPLRPESVDLVVTSVPYYRLRDYLGDERQIGLEQSLEAYVGRIADAADECRRVLRSHGVLCLEVGDKRITDNSRGWGQAGRPRLSESGEGQGLKPYDLALAPSAIAAELRARGWYLRDEIVIRKTSPPPDTVVGWQWEPCRKAVGREETDERPRTFDPGAGERRLLDGAYSKTTSRVVWKDCTGCERCEGSEGLRMRRGAWRTTSSHVMLYVLSKSRRYYADPFAVLEPASTASHTRGAGVSRKAEGGDDRLERQSGRWAKAVRDLVELRNPRSVMTLRPQPDRSPGVAVWRRNEAGELEPHTVRHFAPWPEALPEWCIRVFTSAAGCCASCGAPWARIVDRRRRGRTGDLSGTYAWHVDTKQDGGTGGHAVGWRSLGWRRICKCDAPAVPAVVLDPFVGSGRTLAAAHRLGRRAIGIDLALPYCRLAQRAERVQSPLPLEAAV